MRPILAEVAGQKAHLINQHLDAEGWCNLLRVLPADVNVCGSFIIDSSCGVIWKLAVRPQFFQAVSDYLGVEPYDNEITKDVLGFYDVKFCAHSGLLETLLTALDSY